MVMMMMMMTTTTRAIMMTASNPITKIKRRIIATIRIRKKVLQKSAELFSTISSQRLYKQTAHK